MALTPLPFGITACIMNGIIRLVELAVERFGSTYKLAAATGVAQPTVYKAMKTGRVGPRLAMGIDRVTGGQISKKDLRPDLWPPTPPRKRRAE